MLVSKKFWDKLSPAEQRIMQEAADEARVYQRKVSREAAQKAVAALQAKGIQYNTIEPGEKVRMQEVVKPVIGHFTGSYDPAIVKLYNDELARIRK
ncbi:Bacterial extracellular solute-binding protein, family 7 [compost metagenome]